MTSDEAKDLITKRFYSNEAQYDEEVQAIIEKAVAELASDGRIKRESKKAMRRVVFRIIDDVFADSKGEAGK